MNMNMIRFTFKDNAFLSLNFSDAVSRYRNQIANTQLHINLIMIRFALIAITPLLFSLSFLYGFILPLNFAIIIILICLNTIFLAFIVEISLILILYYLVAIFTLIGVDMTSLVMCFYLTAMSFGMDIDFIHLSIEGWLGDSLLMNNNSNNSGYEGFSGNGSSNNNPGPPGNNNSSSVLLGGSQASNARNDDELNVTRSSVNSEVPSTSLSGRALGAKMSHLTEVIDRSIYRIQSGEDVKTNIVKAREALGDYIRLTRESSLARNNSFFDSLRFDKVEKWSALLNNLEDTIKK